MIACWCIPALHADCFNISNLIMVLFYWHLLIHKVLGSVGEKGRVSGLAVSCNYLSKKKKIIMGSALFSTLAEIVLLEILYLYH